MERGPDFAPYFWNYESQNLFLIENWIYYSIFLKI